VTAFEENREEEMRLKDRVALITGGAAGIGKATAERFAQEGAVVLVADINDEAGLEVVAALGPTAAFFQVNIADRQAVQTMIDEILSHYERIDILINNAGILRDDTLVKLQAGELVRQMSEQDFDTVISVNLKGTFNVTQAVAPSMIRQRSGVILNATSIIGLDGNFGQTNYAASKAGVIGMTRVWARELGRYNIRVNAVAPGFTATEMVHSMPKKILDGMLARTPLARLGQPQEIANAYLFLASDEASFIHGITLRVDGGMVIGT
jgi:3-oxoacyl-[acyl-carrier protein] reductase